MKRFFKYPIIFIFLNILNSNAQVINNQAGYYRFQVGTFEVTALSDGTVPVDAHQLLHPEDPARINKLLAEAFIESPAETSINAYLIKSGSRLILVDTGAGELFGADHGGALISSLKAAGYLPEQITDILLTHIHVDHSGGLTVKNKQVFPNATIHVNKKELDFWSGQEKTAATPGATVNKPASAVLKPYINQKKVRTFSGNVELFPGVSTLEYFGHTPGHTVYVLESGKDKLLFWGDLIHIAAVQLSGPEISNDYDTDKQKAAIQRQKAYADAAKSRYLIAADHISFPGIGRIKAKGNVFEFVAVPYSVLGRNK